MQENSQRISEIAARKVERVVPRNSRKLMLCITEGIGDKWIAMQDVDDEDFRLMLQIAEHEGREGWVSQALVNVIKRRARSCDSTGGLPFCSFDTEQTRHVCDLLTQEEIILEDEAAERTEENKRNALKIADAMRSELVRAAAKGYDIRNGVLRELARRIGNQADLGEPYFASEKQARQWKSRGSPSNRALEAEERLIFSVNSQKEKIELIVSSAVQLRVMGIGRALSKTTPYTALGLELAFPGEPATYTLWNVDDKTQTVPSCTIAHA